MNFSYKAIMNTEISKLYLAQLLITGAKFVGPKEGTHKSLNRDKIITRNFVRKKRFFSFDEIMNIIYHIIMATK